MATPDQVPSIAPFSDDPTCRETFSDGAQVRSDGRGCVHIDFLITRTHLDPTQQKTWRSPVARVVIPNGSAASLAQLLNRVLKVSQAQGQGSAPKGNKPRTN